MKQPYTPPAGLRVRPAALPRVPCRVIRGRIFDPATGRFFRAFSGMDQLLFGVAQGGVR